MTKSKGQTTNDKNKLTIVKTYGFYVTFVILKPHHLRTYTQSHRSEISILIINGCRLDWDLVNGKRLHQTLIYCKFLHFNP